MGLKASHSDHDHSAGSCHNHASGKSQSVLAIAAILTGLFMGAEVIGGLLSGSLALIADAGHMLTDFAALSLAWLGFALAKRPANAAYTFGFARFPVLTAFVNGFTLVLIAAWICIEAIQRFLHPGEVLAGPMLIVAIVGLAVNLLVFWILTRGDQEDLNMRGAILHVIGDMLGSFAAIIAAVIIMTTGWMPIDPVLSVLVAVLILRSAVFLMKESGHILLQGAPENLDRDIIRQDILMHVPGVKAVEHIHIWSLTTATPMITLQVHLDGDGELENVSHAIKARLHKDYHLEHVTLDIIRNHHLHVDDGPMSI